MENPAISVVIPMYNAEEYIGECLDSLLAQTFQDFEVLVIDDGSTDSSCEVVEGYMPKFDGRLNLYYMGENTKHPGKARNLGFSNARGEYIYCVDSDDALIPTGFEEMYNLAKQYDADVVYSERYYMSTGVGKEFIDNVYVARGKIQPPPYVDKPTLESQDLSEKVKGLLNGRYWTSPWLKLVRRDLINSHKIFFPYLKSSEDDIWTYGLIFFAEKWLRVPNIVYIRRMRENSITGTARTPQQTINFWLRPLLFGIKEVDKFMSQIDFFKENPEQRYAVLEKEFQGKLRAGFRDAGQLNPIDVYKAIKDEFSGDLGEYDVLTSALCTQIFNQDKTLKANQQRLKQAEESENEIATKDAEIRRLKDVMSYLFEFRPMCPIISVVIPMYNAEKYIGELLESLLAQTFKAFEVVVVDDCSTDNSVAVVESFMPRFDKIKLILQRLEKNSATGGSVPRNVGLMNTRGEYVYFVDADDYLADTALETFYSAAKKFGADVVYSSSYNLLYRPNESKVLKDGLGVQLSEKNIKDKPTLITNEIVNNLQQLEFDRSFNFPWTYLVRRDLLTQNGIFFPEIPNGVDHLWVIQVYCYAKKFLRIPDALYFYRRYHGESISTKTRESREQVSYWVSAFYLWLKALGELSSRIEVLRNNPSCVLAAARRHFDWCLNRTGKARKELANQDIYEILYREFRKVNISADLVVPFFFSTIDFQTRQFNDLKNKINKYAPLITARIDIILRSKNGDFQIFSISDKTADVEKPDWFQKEGVGYVIKSCAEKLEFVAKPTVSGKIFLQLRGLYVTNPNDKSKSIPYWIDYTKLIVNQKTIFDEVTPACHDNSYEYNINAKANESIKIQVEWFPHSGDPIEKAPVTVNDGTIPVFVNFSRFITARADIKFLSETTEGDFQILSVSDAKATVNKPTYSQNDGISYVLQSCAEKLEFVAKPTATGKIFLQLRGLDVANPDDNFRQIPYWIYYTKLTINEKIIFNVLTPTWYDEPYEYYTNANADEEIKVKIEWFPHKKDILKQTPINISEAENPLQLDFSRFITARADIKFLPKTTKGKFKILSLSDDEATVNKPDWFQNNGVGYVISSLKGKLSFVAKASSDGQIKLYLKGISVFDPNDSSKRIPYWIDYARLTINEKTIFDEPTPVWHDKPYLYTINVTANEEIKIQVEWLPHKSNK